MGSYSPNVSCLDAPVDTLPQVFSNLQNRVPTLQEEVTFGHAPLTESVTERLPRQFPGM